jgi:hypothetical protein
MRESEIEQQRFWWSDEELASSYRCDVRLRECLLEVVAGSESGERCMAGVADLGRV